jgi:hypothetical protein
LCVHYIRRSCLLRHGSIGSETEMRLHKLPLYWSNQLAGQSKTLTSR